MVIYYTTKLKDKQRTDEEISFESTNHDPRMFGTTNEISEPAFRCLITSKSGLYYTGSVIDHHRLICYHVIHIGCNSALL